MVVVSRIKTETGTETVVKATICKGRAWDGRRGEDFSFEVFRREWVQYYAMPIYIAQVYQPTTRITSTRDVERGEMYAFMVFRKNSEEIPLK